MIKLDSKIPFIIAGLQDGYSAILIASDRTPTGLAKYYLNGSFSERIAINQFKVSPKEKKLGYVVRSRPVLPLEAVNYSLETSSKRKANYFFGWIGMASDNDLQQIEELFNDLIIDILVAVKAESPENSQSRLEAILPLLLDKCEQAELARLQEKEAINIKIINLILFIFFTIILTVAITYYVTMF